MPFPKKWREPSSTSVTTEEWKRNILKEMKVSDTQAYNLGIDSILSIQIEKGKVKSPIIEAYLESLKEEKKLLQEKITRISTILQGRLDSERAIEILKNEKIRVWDLADEKHKVIPLSEFNPIIHQKIVKALQVQGEGRDR